MNIQIIPNCQDTKNLLAALKEKFKDMGCQVSDDFLYRMALDNSLVYNELVNENVLAVYNTDLGDYALEHLDEVKISFACELLKDVSAKKYMKYTCPECKHKGEADVSWSVFDNKPSKFSCFSCSLLLKVVSDSDDAWYGNVICDKETDGERVNPYR